MKRIKSLPEACLRTEEIFTEIPKDLEIRRYEKGEQILSPMGNNDKFMIVVEGRLSLYALADNGQRFSLRESDSPFVLGDLEFFENGLSGIYTEALSEVTVLAFSISANKTRLQQDACFLRYVAMSLATKLHQLTLTDTEGQTLPQRILFHMNYHCPNKTLHGIEKNAALLHCSSRQLQRTLNRLQEEKRIIKTGKGTYRLL